MTIAKTLIAATALSVGLLGATSSFASTTALDDVVKTATVSGIDFSYVQNNISLGIGDYLIKFTILGSGLSDYSDWGLNWTVALNQGTGVNQVYSQGSVFDTSTGGNGSSSVSEIFHVATAGTYSFTLSGFSTSTTGTASLTGGSISSVPGPIAGAGVPMLLGLAGFGWMRRRKAA